MFSYFIPYLCLDLHVYVLFAMLLLCLCLDLYVYVLLVMPLCLDLRVGCYALCFLGFLSLAMPFSCVLALR